MFWLCVYNSPRSVIPNAERNLLLHIVPYSFFSRISFEMTAYFSLSTLNFKHRPLTQSDSVALFKFLATSTRARLISANVFFYNNRLRFCLFLGLCIRTFHWIASSGHFRFLGSEPAHIHSFSLFGFANLVGVLHRYITFH